MLAQLFGAAEAMECEYIRWTVKQVRSSHGVSIHRDWVAGAADSQAYTMIGAGSFYDQVRPRVRPDKAESAHEDMAWKKRPLLL